jgi:predicted RNA-binding Zn ribbon-like protein
MSAGTWFRSDSGTRWFLDAGASSLDFAYLGGFPHDSFGPASGLPGSDWDGLLLAADLGDWLSDRFDGLGTVPTDRELNDARGLRDAIARLALCAADGHVPDTRDVDLLNLFAATPDVPPALGGGSRQAGAGRLRVSQAMSSVARDAVALFVAVGFLGDDDRRIKRCAAPDCGLVFHDDSRAGSRRWCSMQKCGNRAKVRAHRARAAQAG